MTQTLDGVLRGDDLAHDVTLDGFDAVASLALLDRVLGSSPLSVEARDDLQAVADVLRGAIATG